MSRAGKRPINLVKSCSLECKDLVLLKELGLISLSLVV